MEIVAFLLVTLGIWAGFFLTHKLSEERETVEKILTTCIRFPVILSFLISMLTSFFGGETAAGLLFTALFLIGSAGRQSVRMAWIFSVIGIFIGIFIRTY